MKQLEIADSFYQEEERCISNDAALFLREAMSHAWTGWQADIESLLTNGRLTDRTHTANAATVRGRRPRA